MNMPKIDWRKPNAYLLLLNAGMGLALSWWQGRALSWLALFGLLAGALCLRRYRAGLVGGLVFYGIQVASYFPFSGHGAFSVKAGLSLAYVVHLPSGVLVLNWLALILMGLCAKLLFR